MASSHVPAEILLKIAHDIESLRDLNAFVQINRQSYNVLNLHLHCAAFARRGRMSTIWMCIYHDRADVCQKFIHAGLLRGANADALQFIETCIPETAFFGCCKILRLLIEHALNEEVPLKLMFQEALGEAVTGGQVQALDILNEYDADLNVNHIYKDGYNLLCQATRRDHGAVIQWLVDHGADIDCPCHDDPGDTHLHRAAKLNNQDAVRALFRCGMSPNEIDRHGFSPFHYAILYQHFQPDEGVELEENTIFFLQHGADPYLRTSNGYTPLWLAICLGKWKTVDLLLEMGISPDDSDANGDIQESISTQPFLDMRLSQDCVQKRLKTATRSRMCGAPLCTAALMGENKILLSLLRHGADPNCLDSNGDMPLHVEARSPFGSFKEMALELIRHGASLNAKDCEGFTPLDWALQRGYLDRACLLIEHGAMVQQLDSDGIDPIFRIFDYYKLKEYTEYDLKGIQSTCRIGWTREMRHSNNHNCEQVFRLFLERGSSVHSRDDIGRSALHVAASRGCDQTMKFLLKMGADPNARDSFGHTPVHKVALEAYADGVRTLVGHDGVNFMARDNNGNTALHLAAQNYGHEHTLDTLFAFDKVGLSPDNLENMEMLGVNNKGQSVMDIIRRDPNSPIYQALALESSSSESETPDRDS